jgi:hypothetical protein
MEERLSEILKQLKQAVEVAIVAGFFSPEQILDKLSYRYSVWPEIKPEDLHPYLEELLRKSCARQTEAQKTWPALTDCGRLDAAFAELESQNILCRENFSINLSNALVEIWDEIRRAEGGGREIRGFVFYHEQDIGSAMAGNLYLSFGSIERQEPTDRAIGTVVIRTLKKNGLNVEWSGSLDERISVQIDWKRRRSHLES